MPWRKKLHFTLLCILSTQQYTWLRAGAQSVCRINFKKKETQNNFLQIVEQDRIRYGCIHSGIVVLSLIPWNENGFLTKDPLGTWSLRAVWEHRCIGVLHICQKSYNCVLASNFLDFLIIIHARLDRATCNFMCNHVFLINISFQSWKFVTKVFRVWFPHGLVLYHMF